ncbi:MAG: SPOR domain-containing protein [Lachnospiraceae bacterium]|nr:SPOR domain-containing protein [Lachnospiraceae bacterium]
MRMLKKGTLCLLGLMLLLAIAGCGAATEKETDNGVEESTEDPAVKKKTELKKPDQKKPDEETEEKAGEQTLAKRLCGKYSARDNEEWMGMEIVSFGDNLYAYVGLDMEEEGEEEPENFDYYSYWAYEFFPVDASELQSTTGNSVEMYRLSFSVMSYAGQYQGAPVMGTITLTENGIVLDGFDEGRMELTRDERAEDMFTYAVKAGDSGADADLQGFWKSTGTEKETYLDFDGNALYILSKTPGEVVDFTGGGITTENNQLQGQFSTLGSGSMPSEVYGFYQFIDGRLHISAEEYSDLTLFNDGAEFERIGEEELPLYTADNTLAYVPGKTDKSALLTDDPLQEPFYGIFVSALTESEQAIELAGKVQAKGFESMVVYSPEWENLSPKKFFCVTAGRYATQQEAEDDLDAVKAVYPDAYVKYSGACRGTHVMYTNTGMGIIEVEDDYAVITHVDNETVYQWSGDTDAEESLNRVFIVDENTVFDPSCETEFFSNYEDGDTPLTWFKRNDELLHNDPDAYAMNGPAFSGVFEIVVTGNHIDAFLGSYWWD